MECHVVLPSSRAINFGAHSDRVRYLMSRVGEGGDMDALPSGLGGGGG